MDDKCALCKALAPPQTEKGAQKHMDALRRCCFWQRPDLCTLAFGQHPAGPSPEPGPSPTYISGPSPGLHVGTTSGHKPGPSPGLYVRSLPRAHSVTIEASTGTDPLAGIQYRLT